MRSILAPLLLIGITVVFLTGNFFTGTKNKLAAVVSLQSLDQPTIVRQNGRRVLIAQIYSTFPFNYKHLIALNAGAEDGVTVGLPVSTDGNILLGQIIEVSDRQAIARTIFDKDWSLSVRIGDQKADALLIGGQNPKLTLIDKNDQILEGEQIFSAQKDFPYGMKIGTIQRVQDLVAHSFKEADIALNYNLKNLREAAIIIK